MNPCCLSTNCQPLSLDPQLLEEREFWKGKYTQLRSQAEADSAALKDSIYQECSAVMETELRAKEARFQTDIHAKNAALAAMNSRVAELEGRVHEL
jgi:hypothetical protein